MKTTQFTLNQAREGFYLNAAARNLARGTLLDYENTINKFVKFVGGDTIMATIEKRQVEQFLASNNHLSNKTLLNYHTGLSALWRWAVGEKIAAENIIRGIPAPKPEMREIVPFTETELKLLLGALEKSRPYTRPGKRLSDHAIPGAERNRALILMLVDTGLRASELCSIIMKNFDIERRRILVVGKGSKERIVQFSPRTGQAVWRYLATRPEKPQPADHLFLTLDGHEMDKDYLRHLLDTIGQRAKINNVHPHRFRHTFAIQYLRNGGDPFTLQMLLGHSTMEMVKRYLHLAQTDLESAHRRASPVDNWRL
jgi:integrase/recombinase XerD